MPRRRENEAQTLSTEFRSSFEDYRAEYDIGGTGRYMPSPRGIQPGGSNADYHYENEAKFFRGIERARHFHRNNMIVGQAVRRLAANLVQDGFTLNTTTGDPEADKRLKADWYDWSTDANRCDFEGEKSFFEMELLAAGTVPVDGDLFCLPLAEEEQLQWMEAHRCRRPSSLRRSGDACIHGVNLDASAKRRSFYFTTKDIDPLGSVKTLKDVIEVNARDADGFRQVLQLYYPDRFSQRRGVTAFAPIALPVQYHDDIQFANLVAAQVQSCYAILEQQDLAGVENPQPRGSAAQTGERTSETLGDGSTRTIEGMGPGMRIRSLPGWKLTGFSPTIPGPRYLEHTLMILSIIAVNLDLPVHVLLLDPSRTNFSGWRGAIEQARIRYRVLQRLLISRLHVPVWQWFVRQRIARAGKTPLAGLFAKLGPQIFSHEWNPPTWAYIEPLKDIQADTLEAASCGTSRRRQKARRGEDWDDIAPEIPEDNAKLILAAQKKAVELNGMPEFADPKSKLTWRDLASLPMPDGITFAMSPEKEPGNSNSADNAEPKEAAE